MRQGPENDQGDVHGALVHPHLVEHAELTKEKSVVRGIDNNRVFGQPVFLERLHDFYRVKTGPGGEFKGIEFIKAKILKLLKKLNYYRFDVNRETHLSVRIVDNKINEVSPEYIKDDLRRSFSCFFFPLVVVAGGICRRRGGVRV